MVVVRMEMETEMGFQVVMVLLHQVAMVLLHRVATVLLLPAVMEHLLLATTELHLLAVMVLPTEMVNFNLNNLCV